jgi:single-strand selective monofunctional uracil DNA glycosylase
MKLPAIAKALINDLKPLVFDRPVAHVYNPLEYAWAPHRDYLQRFGKAPREVVLVGMNPGPWGMVQTGVPFGEVSLVRDWLGVRGSVSRPQNEHPKRPVTGFACTRSEVSGRRLWGWARDSFGTPGHFFSRFFVANYCPLAFLDEGGRNVTPDRLPKAELSRLQDVCDLALRRSVKYLEPRFVIGIGKFAERRARSALDGLDVTIGSILHPSPASPAANRDWVGQVTAQFAGLGIEPAEKTKYSSVMGVIPEGRADSRPT